MISIANGFILLSFLEMIVLFYKVKIKKVHIYSNQDYYYDDIVCPKCLSVHDKSDNTGYRWMKRAFKLCISCERDESLKSILGSGRYSMRLYRLNRIGVETIFRWYYATLLGCLSLYFLSIVYEPFYLISSILLFSFTSFLYLERKLKIINKKES